MAQAARTEAVPESDQSRRIGYFRACYEADNRDLRLLDFLGDGVDHPLLLAGEDDVESGFSAVVAIPEEAAQAMDRTLRLYTAERELLFGGVFVIGGRLAAAGGWERLCAPLFLYPAELMADGPYLLLHVDRSARRLNYALLGELLDNPAELDPLADALLEAASGEELTRGAIHAIGQALAAAVPGIDTEPLFFFPQLWDPARVRQALHTKELRKGLRLVPAAGVGVVRKSTDTLGVLAELHQLAGTAVLSPPLRALFGETVGPARRKVARGRVPGILSAAQEGVLDTASRHPLSLVVGPPGTGKTYTVATVAVEHVSRGQSVLIVARTDEAVDVVARKIADQLKLPHVVVRGGRKAYLRDLREHVQDLLSGMLPSELREAGSSRQVLARLRQQDREIAALEHEFADRAAAEVGWGEVLAADAENDTLLTSLRRRYVRWRSGLQRPLWEVTQELHTRLDHREKDTAAYLRARYAEQLGKVLAQQRKDLVLFGKGLRAVTARKRDEYFGQADLAAILRAFPIWLVRLGDLARNLPLREGLFDLVILDEATQCDVASCLPALQRGQRAVVTGDPRQLRHVSFLSRRRQARLQETYQLKGEDPEALDYRERSALDLVSDRLAEREQAQFLDEHYRSTPDIIRFSNREFYAGALRIMTGRPLLSANEGVTLVPCPGQRLEDGTNRTEGEQVLTALRELVTGQAALPDPACQSIGVLSPFRAQAEWLGREIATRFSSRELERHRLAVGTPYAFQGEERDVMLLSFALDDSSHPTAYRHLARPDVFNVAITRARSRQVVHYSFSPERLPADSLVRRYVEEQAGQPVAVSSAVHDRFCEAVRAALAAQGHRVWVGFPVAGLEIDLIVAGPTGLCGIDLIGYPGQFAGAFTLERYRMLRRAGLRTFPLPYTHWLADQERALREFAVFLSGPTVAG